MLSRVSQMTILSVMICVMNVSKSDEPSVVTSSCPFSDCSCKFVLREVFSHPGNVSVAPAEIRDSNIFLYSSKICSHVECVANFRSQEMMLGLEDRQVSSISSTW